jgi:uncharacterized membrane protein
MEKLAVIVLWALVVASGVLVGGSVFERIVVTPLWAASPPESVTAWTLGAIQRPFFIVVTPLWALLSLGVLALASALPEPARPWARTAGIIGVCVMIATIAFFVPLLEKTEANRGAGLSSADIARFTRMFVHWSYLRSAVALGGWLAALRALTLASR